jgi:predicted Zn-dependent peptidase
MVRTPVFTKENVKKEQGIIAQEIKMCEDRPSDMRIYGLLAAMFGEGSPFSIPIAGTVQSISEITPELLYKCYGAFYRMSNMVLAICGNVDADRIMDIVDRMIDDEPTERALTVAEPQPLAVFKPLVTARAQIAKPIFEIGIKHSAATLDDLAACSMLSAAVFGSCEDFYSGVFEEDLVSSYRFEYEYLGQGSYFSVQGDSFEPMKVLERFKETVNAVKRDGVSRDAFERAKRSVYSGEIMDLDDSESIAESMMDGFVIGQNLIEGIDSVRNVTYEQVNALAKELFCEDRIAMSVVYPLENTGEVNEDEQ